MVALINGLLAHLGKKARLRTLFQNLNQHGSAFWHGRCWFYLSAKPASQFEVSKEPTFLVTWALWGHVAKQLWAFVGFNDGENDIVVSVGCTPLASITFCLRGLSNWQGPGTPAESSLEPWQREPRRTGVTVDHRGVFILLWENMNKRSKHWWNSISIPWASLLLGTLTEKSTLVNERRVSIVMPEGDYWAVAELIKVVRARRWWSETKLYITLNLEEPIPTPGNSGFGGTFETNDFDLATKMLATKISKERLEG